MRLKGSIECRRTAAACVTLVVRTERGERAYVTLSAQAPDDLPARIDHGVVELLEGAYRVSWSAREWLLDSSRVLVHRDASDAFYAALPPRPVRPVKRMLFRLVLAVAGSRAGRWWLAR